MSQLTAKKRAQLRNAAFAYVDSKGRRRLPIHDEAHVRNALARFNQTRFEDDAARERARKRLLTAAKKYGIVPIGFITGQLATERLEGESKARTGVVRGLPSGQVTFLLTDIEDSTGLSRLLEDRYANLLGDVRRLLRRAVQRSGGKEVDMRADELFAVFKRPSGALAAALAIQRRIGSRSWPAGAEVRLRIGIHTGRPTLTDGGYVGLASAHCGSHLLCRSRRSNFSLERRRASGRGIGSSHRQLPQPRRSPAPGPAGAAASLPAGGARPSGKLSSTSDHKSSRFKARGSNTVSFAIEEGPQWVKMRKSLNEHMSPGLP